MNTPLRMLLGAACWCTVAASAWYWTCGAGGDREATIRWAHQLADYAAGQRSSLQLRFPSARELAVGDPIFIQTADGSLKQVGQVTSLGVQGQTHRQRQSVVDAAQAELYPGAPPLSGDVELMYYSTPDSLAWVAQTLLPAEKRQVIAAELSSTFEAHRDEILAALKPIAQRSVQDALSVIEADLPPALARHRKELEAIGARYHKEIVEAEIVPLVQDEVWPIVRRHGEQPATEISRELWARLSLWRFGWRYIYDRSILPEKHLTEKELRRFIDEEGIPILQAHSQEIVEAIERTLQDTARNPRVREALRRNLARVADDPQLQQVLGSVFREVIIDNPRFRDALERNWRSPEAQAAFRLAAERFEPAVRRIGDLVFGTPEEGISPEFAAVLRNQILHKDRRWLLLTDLAPQDATAEPLAANRIVNVKFPQRHAPPGLLGLR